MKRDNWVTYDAQQASQVASGLQLLLDGELLGEKEKEYASSAIRKLGFGRYGESGVQMFPFSEGEYALVNQVEAALWR